MSIITLTSDWGLTDHYVAAVKGAILSRIPDATIVDVSHSITKFSISETAFVVKYAYKNFPENSIHIVGVNSESSVDTPHIVVYYDHHYFVGADNGVFSLICDSQPDEIFEVTVAQDTDYFTFPCRDVFAKVACHIAENKNLNTIGIKRQAINQLKSYLPVSDKNSITGIVVYFDTYDNAITNINETIFKDVGRGRKFTVYLKNEEENRIEKSYSDVANGEIVMLFGATTHLEIAINKGSARNLLGINIYDTVRVEFV
ncbi:MAG: SAM-dependent chlorinase/fluorinase [Bacteroidota bacterium]